MSSLKPNSLVVVTGITGFIASWTTLEILRGGHRVRGIVRLGGLQREEEFRQALQRHGLSAEDLKERLEFVEVTDFYSQEEWTQALRDADGIIHIAFPLDRIQESDLVPLSLKNMQLVLKAAQTSGTIKKFVYTSSSAAVVTAPMIVDRELTVDDWHEGAIDVLDGKSSIDNHPELKDFQAILPYAAAKAKSERLAMEFVEEEKPEFQFISILPDTTFGPLFYRKGAFTTDAVVNSLKGDKTLSQYILSQWFVDVRDVAKIHYLGLVNDSMVGKRWWAVSEPFGWNKIYGILRKHSPGANIPDDYEGGETDRQLIDNSASTAILGGWIPLQKSIVDTVESYKRFGLL